MRDFVVASLDRKDSDQENIWGHKEDEVSNPKMVADGCNFFQTYSSIIHPIKPALHTTRISKNCCISSMA
jgi:hypothetical protein